MGHSINGIYILKSKELKKAVNGKEFIDLIFIDETGEILGKLWDAKSIQLETLALNVLYYVNAQVEEWKGNIQLNLNKLKISDPEDQKEISNFVPSAPYPPEEMLETIFTYIEAMQNAELMLLTEGIVRIYQEKLMYYPAAKSLHHSIRSGLLYHILRMLKTAEMLSKVYEGVNTDLLYAGVILHDMEKVNELDANNLGFADYSKSGQLLGHIVMGVKTIDSIGRELGISEETLLLVEHMIISHHYEAEYGSPKKPMFLEAELLHYIDLIDARVYDYTNVLEKTEIGAFTEPVWSMDKRRLYKYIIP